MAVIEVKKLTKEYQLGALTTIKDNAMNTIRRLQGKPTLKRKRFKALDDVSFSIEKGEVIGIIGTNGAGKSTLLKHLAKITTPTSGCISVSGTVAPLIEVGAGFVPDLTGRENIYLNCSIMGLSRKETKTKIDEIIEFSELKEFIDTPIKRYSSGMSVRLGFAVATSIDADILIVDEVLAVGDLAFQRKCFDRMETLIKRQGKTVLLVSHNIRQVSRLCTRVILLDSGRVVADGPPKTVCDMFYERSDRKIKTNSEATSLKIGVESTNELDLMDIYLSDINGHRISAVEYQSDVKVCIKLKINNHLNHVTFGVGVHTTDFLYLATHNSEEDCAIEDLNQGQYLIKCNLYSFPFLPGVYSLRLGVTAGLSLRKVYYGEGLYNFHVVAGAKTGVSSSTREGFIGLNAKWQEPTTISL